MTFDDFVRAFLACYFSFVSIYYTAKLVGLRQRTGVAHADMGQRGTTQFFGHRVFHIFRALILFVCVARLIWPAEDRLLIMFPLMSVVPLELLGITLMMVALGVVIHVQTWMGDDWRSGVGAERPARLLTDGPFRYTRNPIFLAVIVGQVGFFLALPSLFTLFCLATGALVVIGQAQYEERNLRAAFGATYERWADETPRWLPVPWGARPGRGSRETAAN